MPVKRKTFAAIPISIPNVEEQRLLKISQVAHYLNKSVWMVRQMIASGELRIVGIRKPFLVDKRDLDAYIEQAKTVRAAA